MTTAYLPHLVNSCDGSFTALDGGTDILSCLLPSPAAMTTSPLTSLWWRERTEGLQRTSCAPLLSSHLPPTTPSSLFVFILSCPSFCLLFKKNLICDLWSAWQWVLTKEWSGCHVNSLGCGYASDSAVCRRQKGTGLGQAESVFGLHARIGWRSKPSCSMLSLLCFICQIRLISNLHHSLNDGDRWERKTKWLINEQHGWGRGREG